MLREHYRRVLASPPSAAALGAHTVPVIKHSTAFQSGLVCTHQPFLLCCRFIRDEADDKDDTWEVRLAKRYYSKLFKEYCIADLSRYKVIASVLAQVLASAYESSNATLGCWQHLASRLLLDGQCLSRWSLL